jgi:hypothetical protein
MWALYQNHMTVTRILCRQLASCEVNCQVCY